MYIIIVLVKVKTSNYLSKTNEARGWKKIHNPFVSFDIVTFAIYGNITTVIWLSEILQFFQFSKRDISTARCKCTIYIFTFKGIKVVIRTEFINMTVLLPMKAFFKTFFNFLSEAEFNFSCNKELLYFNVRNWIVFRWAEFRCSGSLFSMLLYKNCISFKFTIDNFE